MRVDYGLERVDSGDVDLNEITREVLPDIIQLVATGDANETLVALCGNGSIWQLRDRTTEDQVWFQIQVRTR